MKQNVQIPFQNRSAAEGAADPRAADEDARSLRVLMVLDALARAQHPQTLAQLSQRLHVPKTTLMRLLAAMERAGFVLQMPAERGFVPGPRAAGLALQTLRSPPLLRECRAILGRLVAALGETCNLTALDGDRVLYVERVETHEPLRLQLSPGIHVPLHCTASGKLFLSAMSRLERQQTLQRLVLTRNTPRTLADLSLLEAELDRLGARGIGVDNEEFVRGMTAVAVPVRELATEAINGTAATSARPVLAAIACHAPTARVPLEGLLRAVPVLQEAAQQMARVLRAE
ncbi:IclR family transcriptional regulator [Cupriavidus gilardii]|uniref:IclR family transcriptional regulator n=1 Tax=Cupriavidus gilardii TaxID=82541 RepID=UPI00157181BA|nr:IclR family transcriptional regulator [Cupriavidus gilardii]